MSVFTLPISKLSEGEGTFPPWYGLQNSYFWRLSFVQENVVPPPASCSGMQRNGMHCTALQGLEGAHEKATAAIRFTTKGCCNGNDEATCGRCCHQILMKQVCIYCNSIFVKFLFMKEACKILWNYIFGIISDRVEIFLLICDGHKSAKDIRGVNVFTTR